MLTIRSVMLRMAFLLILHLPSSLSAQSVEGSNLARGEDSDAAEQRPVPYLTAPYAGKSEPRIGGWVESKDEKLRLDIGTAIDIWRFSPISEDRHFSAVVGTEFFTWTRLRSAGGFKFPVEAVDYYFGLFGRFYLRPAGGEKMLNTRLRIAHVSAHLVDGDTAFFASGGKPVTYSREFVDLRTSLDMPYMTGPFRRGKLELHPYLGGAFLFNTIPDTLGRFSPYAGVDLAWQFWNETPLTLRAGYEARLNTELEPIGEHSLRLGLKLAEAKKAGPVLEGAYYSGRSPYGQYFSRREKYFSLGFSVEH